MPITINSNIASLDAQRRLQESSSALSQSYERLSSGLRINTAADDAAGLAVASSLNANTRVYSQAIRNLNDGISAANIAQSAGQQLTSILMRESELATQSGNGTLGSAQRGAIDKEAQALRNEFNRIIAVTNMNGLNLLDGSQGTITIQAGYGQNGSIAIGTGQPILSFFTGQGTLAAPVTGVNVSHASAVDLADFNGDGIKDIISNGNSGFTLLSLGNGDGTFRAPTPVGGVSGSTWDYIAQDFNGDGKIDLVGSMLSNGKFDVALGNGNGTFKVAASYTSLADPESLASGDFNGDGKLDVATIDSALEVMTISFGNSDGSFSAAQSYATDNVGGIDHNITFADVNGDGIADAVIAAASSQKVDILLGNADGSFRAKTGFTATGADGVTAQDINGDGRSDLVLGDGGSGLEVQLGNGDGSFNAQVFYTTGGATTNPTFSDFNGDGIADLVADTGNGPVILLGNGNGTFKAYTSFAGAGDQRGFAVGDINGDGVADVVETNYPGNSVQTLLTNTGQTAGLARFTLQTVTGARSAMDAFQSALNTVDLNIGALGASESRLNSALATVSIARENFQSAASQIMDVDVAEESANLTKNQILQQAGASILAQANQQPALALQLLRNL